MIVWTGWGILTPFIAMIGMAVGGGLIRSGLPEPVAAIIGGVAGAAAVWFAGKWFNDAATDRVMIDAKTGQRVLFQRRHTLFWVQMQWWAIPVLVTGLLVALGAAVPPKAAETRPATQSTLPR